MTESCAERNAYLPAIIYDATKLPSDLNNIIFEYLRCRWRNGRLGVCLSFVGTNEYGLCECHNPYTPKYPYGTCAYQYIHMNILDWQLRQDTGCCVTTYECGKKTYDRNLFCTKHIGAILCSDMGPCQEFKQYGLCAEYKFVPYQCVACVKK